MADDALTLDAMAWLAPKPKPKVMPSESSPAARSQPSTPALLQKLQGPVGLALLDQVSTMNKHKCLRFVAALTRLELGSRKSTTYQYDLAITDQVKMWCLDENRRRREEKEEMSHCTFHPVVSKASAAMRREKVTNFYQQGTQWLKTTQNKLKKKRDKEAAEADKELNVKWTLSDTNRRILKAAAARDAAVESEDIAADEGSGSRREVDVESPPLTPRRRATCRRAVYVEAPPCFMPTITDHPKVYERAATPVTVRLTSPRGSDPHPDDYPTMLLPRATIDAAVERLHSPKRFPHTCRHCSEVDVANREDFTFKPAIRPMSRSPARTSALAFVSAVRRRWDPLEDDLDETVRLAPPPGMLSQSQADAFFARQQQWRDDVRRRREEQKQEMETRETAGYTFTPRISRHARLLSDRSWGILDADSPAEVDAASQNRRQQSHAASSSVNLYRVAGFRPQAMRLVNNVDDSDVGTKGISPEALRAWFGRLDQSRTGLLPSGVVVKAIADYARASGRKPLPVDADFVAARVTFADFVLLYRRIVPDTS
jgi:hypothetical protein